jgi:hypothetical protein
MHINRKKKDNELFFLWDGKASFWGNWQEVKEELVDFESIHKDYKNYYFIKLLMSWLLILPINQKEFCLS